MDNQNAFKDKRKLQVIKELRKDTVILKPDKGNGVVAIDTTDYYKSLDKLFSDTTKFKRLDADPTNTRLSTLQSNLWKLHNRNKISEEVYQEIRPKNAKIAGADGLSKVHKSFERVPSFWPIIDTIGSTHYNDGKYITKLLNPLTQNEYWLKDTFDAAERTKKIPKELIRNEEYTLISLDAVSLFTNVPLLKNVNIILDRVYIQKLIKTTLSKNVLKKLILDTCQKTAFTFNNIKYEQKDSVSMVASLGAVLANIIMTECEKVIVDNLAKEGTIKFYIGYADDTLLLLERQDICKSIWDKRQKQKILLKAFNGFDKNLKFNIDRLENETPHFLDLEICPNGLIIFPKNTHTWQYINKNSFTLWK